jgi:septum formation protein
MASQSRSKAIDGKTRERFKQADNFTIKMPNETVLPMLVLASSSVHRSSLLERLRIPFDVVAPEIDERPAKGELSHDLVARLALEKARAVGTRHPDSVIIGSDQVAVYMGDIVGKPRGREGAARQLHNFSGQTVQFLTSVAVLANASDILGHAVVETRVEFRRLSDAEIERYLDVDQPLDCAGSFKAESLGPSLFRSVFSQDPTAIIGLPLIETARLLRMAGFQVP